MKGILATWPIPGKPRDTVDHIFADANETNLATMKIKDFIKREIKTQKHNN